MRLIDADALLAEVREQGVLGSGHSDSEREDDVCDMIDHAPTIDAVPVVRCGKCKHWVKFGVSKVGETDKVKACELAIWTVGENGHCVCGERKDGDK